MTTLNTSKTDLQDLPFYLNDYDEQNKNFITFRLTGNLNYTNIISADFSQNESQLNDQFETFLNDLQNLNFFIRSSNLILSNSNIKSLNRKAKTTAEIYENCHNSKKSDSIRENLIKFIHVELIKPATVSNDKNENFSPVFTNHKGVCQLQTTLIPIDCLVLVDQQTKFENLYEILLEKLNLHFQAIKQCYLKYYQKENSFYAETFYFLIENHTIVTCLYPTNNTDDRLAALRKEIHTILELPLDRSLLRRSDAFNFKEEVTGNSNQELTNRYLQNPHPSAKPSNVQNGKQSLVQGNYLYFHYLQDGFNDNGWGCAYRSFQTIFSWFKLQNYTNKPIPRHIDIQQALVDMGDKAKNFLGSSKWIGSMEISFCLSQMLNVDCKILSVSKGSDIADKARELQYHFETEGTPIMIGGGVLAHTIIGVDFSELTGDVKFLILDPHYTGGEDIKIITNKGWIGWKDIKFWNDNSYYNMCCPIRPKGV